MKKLFAILFILITFSTGAFAAKYKVNPSGQIKSPSGKTQTPSSKTQLYNIYSSQTYTSTNQVNKGSVPTIQLVMDYSGSMVGWIDVAKKTMSFVISQIPTSTKVGLRVFGQNHRGMNPPEPNIGEVASIQKSKKRYIIKTKASIIGSTSGGCSATMKVTNIQANNGYNIINAMNSTNTGGSTPLTYALDRTVNSDFVPFDKSSPKKIVLITDGGENCGGDPCEFAKKLVKSRSDIHIDVILLGSNSSKLICLSEITGGHFYTTDNYSDFSTVLSQSMNSTPTPQTKNEQSKKQNYEFYSD